MENAKSVKPNPGFVVLEPVENSDNDGLALPDTQSKEMLQGRIIAVGDEAKNKYGQVMWCPNKEGDIVIYRQYSEQDVVVNWKKYTIAKFEDLLGVIE